MLLCTLLYNGFYRNAGNNCLLWWALWSIPTNLIEKIAFFINAVDAIHNTNRHCKIASLNIIEKNLKSFWDELYSTCNEMEVISIRKRGSMKNVLSFVHSIWQIKSSFFLHFWAISGIYLVNYTNVKQFKFFKNETLILYLETDNENLRQG